MNQGLEDARARVAAWLRAAGGAPPARRPPILRLEVPLPEVDPLVWLGAQTDPVQGYWADRDGGGCVAAIGEADLIKGRPRAGFDAFFEAAAPVLSAAPPDTRYYGGFRFAPDRPPGTAWSAFGSHRFLLPLFEVGRRGNASFLACNLTPRTAATPAQILRNLETMPFPSASPRRPLPEPRGRRDAPGRRGWAARVGRALDRIRRGRVAKIVLARRTCFVFARDLDPYAVLQRVVEDAAGCFQFYGSHLGRVAFLGASPERLYRRAGRWLESEALAGTRARGATPAEDARLGRALEASPKDRREHALVAGKLGEAFSDLCGRHAEDPHAALVRLPRVQHLRTCYAGNLHPGVTDAEILARLHPTPAVAGDPRDDALALMHKLEPFDRGWYSGPVGWVGPDGAEFAVALRCGLAGGRYFCLYAGAGLVEGSDAEAEWDEIESKMTGLLRLFPSTPPP